MGWVYRGGASQTAGVTGPVRAGLSSRATCPLGRQPAADGCAPHCWPGRGFARAPCGFVRIRLWLLVPLFEGEPQLPVPGAWFQVQPLPSGGPCGPHCGCSGGGPGSLWSEPGPPACPVPWEDTSPGPGEHRSAHRKVALLRNLQRDAFTLLARNGGPPLGDGLGCS